MKIQFYLRFHSTYKQTLWISGNIDQLGNDDPARALPMAYLDEEFWFATLEMEAGQEQNVHYNYLLKNGEEIQELENDRTITFPKNDIELMELIDTWNYAGEFENAFFTAPFQKTLLAHNETAIKIKTPKHFTHHFKVKAPLLKKNEVLCLIGTGDALGNWKTDSPIFMEKEGNWWSAKVSIEKLPVAYKYGVYNIKNKQFELFEDGNNRLLYGNSVPKKSTVVHDGFIHLANNTWKGAGVAIPVFSLRSKNSFGVGEFTDLKLLVDWAKATHLKLIQLLPVNDTTATHTSADSYPYAAISAFALHPIFINLEKAAGEKNKGHVRSLKKKQKLLNHLPDVEYVEVMKLKLKTLKELYELSGKECFESNAYKDFFKDNVHWLVPYAAFCYLRDKYGSSDYKTWKSNSVYNKAEIEKLCAPKSKAFNDIAVHFFIQFHLHLQLKEAADYAHKHKVVLKGDIPIGIYRFGCDAWMSPELYNMDQQAGAPPDDFAVKGQNWGFPTYNWKAMQESGFTWWKQRFEQMSRYFDAFRIDHILGFFRIWSIPMHAVEGILGHFVPAIPIHLAEFGEKGIWFDHRRYCKPYITEEILTQFFGPLNQQVKNEYLIINESGGYVLKMQFETQRKVEEHFKLLEESVENKTIKQGLFDLISNIILIEEENSAGDQFHFRIAVDTTPSFKQLDAKTQWQLKDLYNNYFYYRQDEFWRKEAMHKLPYLKRTTNMLICGEDLGMVPHSVPEVMKQLGILSLEIQRMPKESWKEFFHPKNAPYLSVVTPSTHDMSTIRGWWEEDAHKTQRFFNTILAQVGHASYFCDPWINKAIVLQHLHSPAMWSIFQLQDILGMDESLRRPDPHHERINVPADPKHFWKYRMHITLENLLKQKKFNEELQGYVVHSKR